MLAPGPRFECTEMFTDGFESGDLASWFQNQHVRSWRRCAAAGALPSLKDVPLHGCSDGWKALPFRWRGHVSINGRTCQHCVHFIDDPAFIEAEFPSLTIFGSAYSSARGEAGICQELDRFMDPLPARACASFTARGESEEQA